MFGPNTVGVTAELIETGNSDGLIYKYALFLFAFAAELFFLMKARNAKLAKADYDDMYLGETSTSKRTQKPIIVMLVILAVFTILACTSWKTMFGVEFFENIHATLTEWTIKLPHIHVTSDGFDVGTEKVAILSKLFGEISAFGNWYYSEMAVVCVIFALIIGRMYKIKSFEAMGEGAKKMIKPALMVTLAYTVIYFCGMEMFYPTIAKVILGLTKNFNVITSFISMVLGSILHVDILYVANYVAPQIMAQTGASTTTVAVLTQAVYGSMMFIASTSAFLVFGLTYLNVPYKEYVKKVWKLALVFLGISLFVTFLADSFKDAESLKSLVAVYYISCLLIGVLNICSLWKVFKKAGKPGWASIIPIYNLIVMLQIADEPIWHIVFLIIPIYNIIYTFKLMIKFAKKFGASTAFGVLLVLMYPIFMTTLAFGNYKYKK